MATINKAMGRIPNTDLRRFNHLLPKISSSIRTSKIKSRMWTTLPALNQGNKGYCVAYSGVQWLAAAPIINITKWYDNPESLQKLSRKYDGQLHKGLEGSNSDGLFMALKKTGFVKNYKWAIAGEIARYANKEPLTGEDLVNIGINHIINKAPIVVGSEWFSSMYEVVDGFTILDRKEESIGGHNYLIKGVDLDIKCPDKSKGAFRILNSWGIDGFGDEGEGWISFSDAAWLWSMGGDIVTADELLKGKRIG